jgi:hypothetical protein
MPDTPHIKRFEEYQAGYHHYSHHSLDGLAFQCASMLNDIAEHLESRNRYQDDLAAHLAGAHNRLKKMVEHIERLERNFDGHWHELPDLFKNAGPTSPPNFGFLTDTVGSTDTSTTGGHDEREPRTGAAAPHRTGIEAGGGAEGRPESTEEAGKRP